MLKWEAMGGFRWIAENWVTALNTVGVVGGLFFTAFSLHSESKTRRFANLLTITKNHRNIWADFYRNPGLARVLDTTADLSKNSVTREEEIFVNLVILHTNSVFYATKDELVVKLEGLRRDVWWFFSLPIPQAVWERAKLVQNDAFVAFVESCRNWK
jgi:hypothetical protein